MDIFKSFTESQWATPAPSENDAPWTARDVLVHTAVSEAGQLGQIQRNIKGEVTVPDDFDLARFNRRSVQKNANRTNDDLFNEIETQHQNVLKALDEVAEADLDRKARHARGDILTVEEMFIRVTEHRRQHAEELKKVISG
jgi:hypothetical protein